MIFMMECIAACALFTAALEILCAKRREIFTNDHPPPFDRSAVWFHFKGSVRGMIIGLAFAPVVGLIVLLLQSI